MAEADRFASMARRILKLKGAFDDAVDTLTDCFVSCLPDLPDNLKYDVSAYFLGANTNGNTSEAVEIAAAKLQEFILLFEGDYEKTLESFSPADWEYIRDITSDFALELDQHTLNYVMKEIVARGIIK